MRVLLDTHVLLWALAQPHRLDEETRATLESGSRAIAGPHKPWPSPSPVRRGVLLIGIIS